MKGIVFSEFLEYLERSYGDELADKVIVESDVPSKGAYTVVGSYPFSEMVLLLSHASRLTNSDPDQMLQEFGKFIFNVFVREYGQFFEGQKDGLKFLASIEDTIHPEVKKLYPDAELPRFIMEKKMDNELTFIYYSSRKMGYFAKGLIEGCMLHFSEHAEIKMDKINEDGSEVRFHVRRIS